MNKMLSFFVYYGLVHAYRMDVRRTPEYLNYQQLIHAGCVSSSTYQVTRIDNAYGNAYRLDGCTAVLDGSIRLEPWKQWRETCGAR